MTITTIMLGVVTGLALASIYILISVSFTIILAASGVFNFAQGTIVMMGTILAFILGVHLGWAPLITAAATAGVGIVAGLLTHFIAVLPAMGRTRSFSHTTMLTTIGLATAANSAVSILFGSDSHRVPSYVSDDPLFLFSIPIRPIYLVMIATGIAVTILVEWVVRRTSVGHIFRATLEDPECAQLFGINTGKIIAIAFGIAGGMSALAGLLIAPVIAASAYSAQELTFYGFAGMALSGFGSFAGALFGSVIVGLISGIVPAVANPHLALPLIWLVVVVVLLVKPSGLWGTAGLFGSTRIREV
ncbi:branched-chain amino acid ABC transporter permease [Pollutimonas bauzanensis]|uniref:Branched-chain amino acid transport system permease protein n=1 Tax=Pollutimonas bauzanensis TaxID=658167 RepID=A0A1M5QJY3_9BURK|nr:branched-chain amino acid ABC transporter permease [Pollutimonas bauzanensis]SHH14415.1 branched-chain amino acid transport system permease protein [Pollutimonas bauzanensis]